MSPKLALLILLTFPSMASELTLDARVEIASSRRDIAAQTVLFETEALPVLTVFGGVRLSRSLVDLHALDYTGALRWEALDFFSLEGRLHHAQRFHAGVSTSHFVALASLHPTIGPVTVFFEAGWYERFLYLRELTIPSFSSSTREHDWLGAFGVELDLARRWGARAQIATFEEISIYNLNNPFLEGRIAYEVDDWSAVLEGFFRYHLLLGFGRWDSLVSGFAVRFTL